MAASGAANRVPLHPMAPSILHHAVQSNTHPHATKKGAFTPLHGPVLAAYGVCMWSRQWPQL